MKTHRMRTLSSAVLTAFATCASAQQAVILVRHAELQGAAMAEPKNLPLSEAGEARAGRLATILKDAGIVAIYVTDFLRTKQTAQALAREIGVEPTALAKGDPRELVERIRRSHDGQTVLLVGHTDTLPGLLQAFGHPAQTHIDAQDYGKLFVLVPKRDGPPTLLQLRY